MKTVVSLNRDWAVLQAGAEEGYQADVPMQLYDILRANCVIGDLVQSGDMSEYLTHCRKDWIYQKEFEVSAQDRQRPAELLMAGVDTLADVFLNGEKLAEHRDLYLPLRLELTGRLAAHNTLKVLFHSPLETLERIEREMPEHYRGHVQPSHMMRIDGSGFTHYFGNRPCSRPLGLYDDVTLTFFDRAHIASDDIRVDVSPELSQGIVRVSVQAAGDTQGCVLRVLLTAPDKTCAAAAECPVERAAELLVEAPELWWPYGYGQQPLYTLQMQLCCGDAVLDERSRQIGFRKIVMEQTLHFKVNGVPLHCWGSNFAPLHAHSYCYDHEKACAMLDWAQQANMNCLRVWGGGVPYRDALYEACDRRGILIWQDFFHDWGMYPNEHEYRALCTAEAEHLVGRLKHHPSILLWCGGNECYQGSEMEGNARFYGWEIFEIDYRGVVSRLDPARYYHPNSPYGGDYANDPQLGDSHVYSHIWYNRGWEHPVFQTENCRVFVPHLRSLEKMLGKDDLWEDGYTGQVQKPGDAPFPLPWHKRALLPDYLPRLPPIERFYEADHPEALIYRFGAAHALHMKETIEIIRRGKPSSDAFGKRRCSGHLMWRLFDTAPEIFCSLIDYYGEPYLPYYAVRRAYEPVLISFEKTDHLVAFVVNDTAKTVRGTLEIRLFDPRQNAVLKTAECPVLVRAGESAPLISLDHLGEFRRECFLYAQLRGEDGEILSRTNDYLDIERHLYFPPAKLELIWEAGELYVRSDRFARCVELSAESEQGDSFGFRFEDNYFDLFPWEKKKIRLLGAKKPEKIFASSQFCENTVEIDL